MNKAVVIGSAVIDTVFKSSGLKVMKSHQVEGGVGMCEVYGGKLAAEEAFFLTGGAGGNVAVGLRRLGILVLVLVRIGDDNLGKLIITDLEKEGVITDEIQKDKLIRTAMSAVLVAPDGGRSIITYRGASALLDSSQVNWNKLKKASWIQIGSTGGNMDFIEDVVGWAVKNDIKVGLAPGKGEMKHMQRLERVLKKIDFVALNRFEAALFANVEHDSEMNV